MNVTDGADEARRLEPGSHAGSDAGGNAGTNAGDMQAKGRFRDPEKARAAANERWSKQRESQDAADTGDAAADDRVVLVTVPARIGTVIAALEREAAKGNANAGRELRSWLAEYPPADTELSVEKLDKRTRERALAYVLASLAEEDAAKEQEA
jgi:hypothetical protein